MNGQTSRVTVEGRELPAYVLALGKANLVLVIAPKGFVMCGYLNIDAAEKMQDAACVVKGVTTAEELLDNMVVQCTEAAVRLGISVGISGREALARML